MSSRNRACGEPIAVIGMGCRFPGGVEEPESFFRLLLNGVDAVTDIPRGRFEAETFYHAEPGAPGKLYVNRGGFVDKVDEFEPECFRISPREAAFMDPQQRLLLEVAWDAFEDAGAPMSRVAGSPTGVFIGVSTWDYSHIQTTGLNQRGVSPFSAIGTSLAVTANRLSYCFDLKGPSMAIDTACSSSLVAIDRAIHSLRSGECRMAVAGGVNLLLAPETFIAYCASSLLSRDGRCKAFDASANGFVRGEGAGVVLLKPLADAERDGDPVLAVILASGLNQDGRTEGIAFPSGEAQLALLEEVYREAGVDPADVRYVEAHGTGTAAGDPVEANTVGRFFSPHLPPGRRLLLGSVKTNIGHLEAASGIASVIKLVQCLRHRVVPPNLHFQKPNPKIDFESLKLQVPTEPVRWPEDAPLAIASTNSFGFGGTNAHLVLSEYRPTAASSARAAELGPDSNPSSGPLLLPVTARSETALRSLARAFAALLSSDGAPRLSDVCYTAAMRRTLHPHRLALTVSDAPSAAQALSSFAEGGSLPRLSHAQARPLRPKIVLVFSGQGTQWPKMALRLMKERSAFASVMERCETSFRDLGSPWSLLEEIRRDPTTSRLQETPIAQPAIFAVQAGLVELWRSWGIEADAVLGHSIGEVAAAYAAGAYSLEDAARLAYHRGRTMGLALDGGRMLAADLSEAEALETLGPFDGRVSLAAVNAPSSVTFAGRPADIDGLEQQLEEAGTWCKLLNVNHAFHSRDMDDAREPLLEALEGLSPSEAHRTFLSTVTGGVLDSSALNAGYWWKNVRQPVRFHQCLQAMLSSPQVVFVEVGPHPALLQSILQSAASEGQKIDALPSLRRGQDETGTMLDSLGTLFTLGCPVDFRFLKSSSAAFVELPHHPWTRRKYWNEAPGAPHRRRDLHPLLGRRLPTSDPIWRQTLDLKLTPYLADHRVDGKIVVPGAAFVEMAASAAKIALVADACELERVRFHRALLLSDGSTPVVETRVHSGERRVEISSAAGDDDPDWMLLFSATFGECDLSGDREPARLEALERELPERMSVEEIYGQFERNGLEFGARFRGIRAVRRGESRALGEVSLDETLLEEAPRYGLHPALLDPCFQTLSAALPSEASLGLYLPESIARIEIGPRSDTDLRSLARLTLANELIVEGDLALYTPDGALSARVEGFRCRRAPRSSRADESLLKSCLYEIDWRRRSSTEETAEPVALEVADGTWVLFADDRGLGETLATELERRGARCARIYAGNGFEERGPGHYVVDPADRGDLQSALRACTEGRLHDVQGVVHLWALDELDVAEAGATEMERVEAKLCHALMHVIQCLDDRSFDVPTWLFLATRGAAEMGRGDLSPAFQQTLLAGLGRVIANELRHYQVRHVDLDPAAAASDPGPLLAEILAASPDEEVALRDGERWVPRLERSEPERIRVEATPEGLETPLRLDAGRRGALDSLTWRETIREPVGADELEIAVTHVGLNFRDVLKALGLYPAESPVDLELGDECVGTVVGVGAGVRGIEAGDRVVAFSSGCLRSHAVVPAAFVLPLPAHYGPAEAATLPVAFLTVLHSLHTLARITDQDTILIHSAAGGVGMAALQIAKRAGARIFATAGSEEKRSLLRQMGVDRVMSSRTLDFADEVRELTNGRGVDIVLNSLAGRAMMKSLECLAPYGRFLELGKRDIYGGTRIDLWPFRKSVSYFSIDLARVLFDDGTAETEALREFSECLANGTLEPLPLSTYAGGSVSEAFRSMSQGRHVGKIVIDLTSSAVVAERAPAAHIAFEPDGTYLVSGGLGGFGLRVARWIVANGGRHLALLGRREPSGKSAEVLDELRGLGAQVSVARCDVADGGQLAETLAEIRETLPPLRGVFHLAAVLEDGILLNLSRERFSSVIRPKAFGAWNLHRLTLDEGLEHFVLFSSISATIGNPGQASYAAANSFLEGLAAYRRSRGLPAKTVAWGLLSDAGMAAGRDGLIRISDQRGLLTMTARECLETLPAVMRRRSATSLVARFAWDRFSRAFGSGRTSEGVLASMLTPSGGEVEASGSDLLPTLVQCPLAERRERLGTYLATHVARILAASPEKIELERPLHEQGFDSLMLVELALVVQDDFGSQIPSASVSPSASIATLAATVAEKLESASTDLAGLSSRDPEAEGEETLCRPILMRASGDLDPLFLVHPLGVHEGVYRPLVNALAPDRPIYGISSNLEAKRSQELVPIDARVEAFVESIREIQPRGPYLLCGYSMGGHLALKTARLLEEMGERVDFVGLIEWELALAAVAADITSTQVQTSNLFVAVYRLLETRFGILAHLPQERLVREASEAARRMTTGDHDATASAAYEWMVAKGYLVKNVSRELLEGYFGQLFVNFSLLSSDSPVRRIEAPVYVWRARDGLGAGDYAWSELVPNLRAEAVVEGDHFSIMIPPSCIALGRSIGKCLEGGPPQPDQ